MKRNMLKVVAASLAGAMLLTACGGSGGANQRPAPLQRKEAQAVRKSLPWHRPVTGIPSCR